MDNIAESDEKPNMVDKPIIIYDDYFKFITVDDDEPIYFYNYDVSN